MNILLFGPPGTGKGTQSELLVKNLNMAHVSTGDLFRAAIKDETELGQKAKSFIDKGELVPDSVTIGLIREVFENLGGKEFILDGFPRTIPQAEALDELLGSTGLKIGKAIFLDVPRTKLMGRLTGRRICKGCGSVFHIESKPPQKEGVCDYCGKDLYQRPDDNADVIENRLEAYDNSTMPLKGFYGDQGILTEIKGDGEVEEVYKKIEKELSK